MKSYTGKNGSSIGSTTGKGSLDIGAGSTVAQTMDSTEEDYYLASQWQLMGRKFRKHKLAIAGGIVLIIFYLAGLFCEFLSPYDPNRRFSKYADMAPMQIHFIDAEGRFHPRPFVYGITSSQDEVTWEPIYVEDTSKRYPIKLFVRGDAYKMWGFIRTNVHLFGVESTGVLFIFGTDSLSRDLFSRNLYAARLSLSVGLVGVTVSFILGCLFGGLAGFYGGSVDMVIQRVIEFLLSIPKIPLWLALAAALPDDWSMIKIYFGITVVLSLVGWTGLARVVRGKLLQLRGEDFVLAAKISGAPDREIITRHLLPSFLSYLIVNITLRIPHMILGETALSFLGVGLREPAVSWGVLLQDAQNVRTIALHPWLLLPALFVIVAVLAFNFLGDGLRDAADPYK